MVLPQGLCTGCALCLDHRPVIPISLKSPLMSTGHYFYLSIFPCGPRAPRSPFGGCVCGPPHGTWHVAGRWGNTGSLHSRTRLICSDGTSGRLGRRRAEGGGARRARGVRDDAHTTPSMWDGFMGACPLCLRKETLKPFLYVNLSSRTRFRVHTCTHTHVPGCVGTG